MVIVQELQKVTTNDRGEGDIYKVSLFADTKSEMSGTPAILGLPVGALIAASSTVLTASGELAFMKSDGTWNWVGE